TGTAVLARRGAVGLGERLEDQVLLLRSDADPRIADGEVQEDGSWELGVGSWGGDRFAGIRSWHRAGDPKSHFDDDFALLGELEGVIDEIVDDLPEAERITHQGVRDIGVDVVGEFQTSLTGSKKKRVQGVGETVAEGEVDRLQAQLARLDRRDVE